MKWSEFFTPATYSGISYGSGDLSPGDLAPEDLVLHEVRRRLLEDPKLFAIFGPYRLIVVDGPNPFDFENLPKISIYCQDTSEQQAPSLTNMYTVQVQIEIKYSPSALGFVEPGYATVASVVGAIKRRLKMNHYLVTQVAGDQRQLAKLSRAGPVGYRFDVDAAGGRYAIAQIIPWTYHLDVDYSTGQVRTLL